MSFCLKFSQSFIFNVAESFPYEAKRCDVYYNIQFTSKCPFSILWHYAYHELYFHTVVVDINHLASLECCHGKLFTWYLVDFCLF